MATFHPFPRLPPELRAHIWSLTAHPRLVHRLRVTVDGDRSYDSFCYFGWEIFAKFPMIKEMHIAIEESVLIWASAFEDFGWGSCPRENIRFIDNTSGLMLTGLELQMTHDWLMFHSWDCSRKVEDLDNLVEEIEWANDDSHLRLCDLKDVE
ncbi:hypothetical protein PT974_09470 [Cladobotryum mycophilum]|uniref:2EXR domain-containing protein n=1 Tax=Cladobotryum mycophilum TaxID=491253 RepID=A0ABR0SG84_9HYPO